MRGAHPTFGMTEFIEFETMRSQGIDEHEAYLALRKTGFNQIDGIRMLSRRRVRNAHADGHPIIHDHARSRSLLGSQQCPLKQRMNIASWLDGSNYLRHFNRTRNARKLSASSMSLNITIDMSRRSVFVRQRITVSDG